jgi:hypothetical protein
MNSKFIVYTGDPADPLCQVARAVEAASEDEAWGMFPYAITIQRFDPIDPKWRRTGDPDWEKLQGGIRVL